MDDSTPDTNANTPDTSNNTTTTTATTTTEKDQAQASAHAKNTPNTTSAVSTSNTSNTTTTTTTTSTTTTTAPQQQQAQPQDNQATLTQQLSEAEKDLVELISRKRKVDKALSTLESSIFTYEGSYLEDTQKLGNIVKGFEGYLTSRADKRKFNESDRLFSLSSVTYLKALEMKKNEQNVVSEDDGKASPAKRPTVTTKRVR